MTDQGQMQIDSKLQLDQENGDKAQDVSDYEHESGNGSDGKLDHFKLTMEPK